jgi:subtilisin family serine protease
VLDSGIDYTHSHFGGTGTLAAYAAAYGTAPGDPLQTTRDGLFPTTKVVDGFDFVGEAWDGSTSGPPLAPDPDPIDFQGHGSHVADIIGGVDVTTPGVAPGVNLYALKVCSAVATACSGVALIQGMDFAVDPNGDGDTSDAVDIINMSLGSQYGQSFDDDLSQAIDTASALGVLTVASAGNSADKPFITGTPAATSTALSVAQTQVPSAALQLFNVDGTNYPAVFQSWSAALTATIRHDVVYAEAGNLNGCAPFSTVFTGEIVLVDRGGCTFTAKIANIASAGGGAGIIGLVAPGAPFEGGFDSAGCGGVPPAPAATCDDIPGYMINQADFSAIKAQIDNPGVGTLDPTTQLPVVGQMVGSSSRGPNFQNFIVKPEIGAPGASVSAEAGTGTGTTAFGGTSGAAPMVAGSAALLLQAESSLSPVEVKARLVGTGETDIFFDPFSGLAEISLIGGGEVRVDDAVNTPLAAWDSETLLPTLSFGHIDVAGNTVKVNKTVQVHNYGTADVTLTISPTFRFADDAASGAVEVKLDGANPIKVNAGRSRTFQVELTINGALLSGNPMNSGSGGADGGLLTEAEFDGYVMLDDGNGTAIHVPWHVIPRQAAQVSMPDTPFLEFRGGRDDVRLRNSGVGVAQNDAYSLLGLSPNLTEGARGAQSPTPDLRAVGVNTFPVPAGLCSANDSFVWAFATNTWERQTHAVTPGSYWWDLDIDQDGILDYAVFNWDQSAPLATISDGRNVTWAASYDPTGTFLTSASAFFFTEHSTVTGNTVMLICGEQVGLTGTDLLATNVDIVNVIAFDNYFGGPGDLMGPFTITPLGEQYVTTTIVDVPGKSTDTMTVTDFGPFPGNTPELGIMLFTNGDRGTGARGGATEATEALIIPTKESRKLVKDILSPGAVTKFVLVDADKNAFSSDDPADFIELHDGAQLVLSDLPKNFNIRAVTEPDLVGSVLFSLNGNDQGFRLDSRRAVENFWPYAAGGDDPVGNYLKLTLTPGTHTLTATPYSGGSATGLPGLSLTVQFLVSP